MTREERASLAKGFATSVVITFALAAVAVIVFSAMK